MKVVHAPGKSHPYHLMLGADLEKLGIEVECLDRLPSLRRILADSRSEVVYHLHWIDMLHRSGGSFYYLDLCVFLLKVHLIRGLKIPIVWTMHNLTPHEDRHPKCNRLTHDLVVRRAGAVLVHCQFAREKFIEKYGFPEKVHVAPLGNYTPLYPEPPGREAARKELGIDPDAFVYLHFGLLRPYKGVEELVGIFREMKEPGARLLIVGQPLPPEFGARLLERVGQDQRIDLRCRFVEDAEVPLYFAAADVFVAPFREVLTSASIVLALSQGIPVVAPAIGCLPETVPPGAGILYDPCARGALGEAMVQVRSLDPGFARRACRQACEAIPWSRTAEVTLGAYEAAFQFRNLH